MLHIKSLIKKYAPLIWDAHLKLRTKLSTFKVNQFNRKYRKAISNLYDEVFFEDKLNKLNSKKNTGYYIIALQNPDLGIYGYLNFYLPHIAYALSKGLIPIIDMQNYHCIYQENHENAWERFYLQPCGVGLEEIRDKKTFIQRCPTDFWYHWLPSSQPLMSDRDIVMWSHIYSAFIHYNDKSKSYLADEMKRVLIEPEKTIGVIYRGGAYTKGKAKGHPVQPTMKMLADKVQEMMRRNHCNYIYLASDEKSIVKYMNSRFPGKILINRRMYFDEVEDLDFTKYNDGTLVIKPDCFHRENNEYLMGIEYISSMNLVANCRYLVAGACGGTTAVLYMNGGKFAEKYIFDLGRYGQE